MLSIGKIIEVSIGLSSRCFLEINLLRRLVDGQHGNLGRYALDPFFFAGRMFWGWLARVQSVIAPGGISNRAGLRATRGASNDRLEVPLHL